MIVTTHDTRLTTGYSSPAERDLRAELAALREAYKAALAAISDEAARCKLCDVPSRCPAWRAAQRLIPQTRVTR
jgi:hypothetical protein